MIWVNSKDKMFSVSDNKLLLQQNGQGTSNSPWKIIWKSKAPGKAASLLMDCHLGGLFDSK